MAKDILLFCTIYFILMESIFINIVKSELFLSHNNEFNGTLSWKSVSDDLNISTTNRMKRSNDFMPFTISARIRYKMEINSELVWIKADQYTANEYLPVVLSYNNLNLNTVKNIGDFSMYYDINQCSAVIYFANSNSFYGIFGMNYYIQDLPFIYPVTAMRSYILTTVDEPYIKKSNYLFNHIHPGTVFPPPSDTNAWYEFLRPLNYDSDNSRKRPSDTDPGPSSKRQHTDDNYDKNNKEGENNNKIMRDTYYQRYYLETLVFVTRDMAQLFNTYFGDESVEQIVRYFLIYFNAINMFLKKLNSAKIGTFINIAKIVIEHDSKPFDFISDVGQLEFNDIVTKLPQYLHSHGHEYTPDSFDHVFVYTSRSIMDMVIPIIGLTKSGADLYEARKNNKFYDVVSITVMQFQSNYADYVVALREISRVFNMKTDVQEVGLTNIGQCYGIMQKEGPKCINCLRWSDKSEIEHKIFFMTNRNRCFLLNQPRSLLPHVPGKLITPSKQCQCFGYDFYSRTKTNDYLSGLVGKKECSKPLHCKNVHGNSINTELTVRPFDGTRCGRGSTVCWNGECVK